MPTKVNPSGGPLTPDRLKRALAEAFGRWSAISNFNFALTDSDDSDISIVFGDVPKGVLANTQSFASSSTNGPITKSAAITFGNQYRWASIAQETDYKKLNIWLYLMQKKAENDEGTNYDLVTTAVHEIGHALGLGHNPDPDSIMQESIGDWNSTSYYYMSNHPLPDVDAESLAKIYADSYRGAPPVIPTGYAIVGSTYGVSNIQSTAPFKDIEEFCWGDRETYTAQLMSGYAQNPFMGQRGYAQLLIHLLEPEAAAGRLCVVGGGVLLPPSASVTHADGTGYSAGYQWGNQQGQRQIVARTIAWNPAVNGDTEALVYFTLSASAPGARITAFATEISSANSAPGTQYPARQWGNLNAPTTPGTHHICSVGRTWPVGKENNPAYGNAYSATYISVLGVG